MNRRQTSAAILAGVLLCIALSCWGASAFAIHMAEDTAFDRAALILSALDSPEQQERAVLALKQADDGKLAAGAVILERYGYSGAGDEFLSAGERAAFMLRNVLPAAMLAGGAACLLFLWDRDKRRRIAGLTGYLREMNAGSYPVKPAAYGDAFSGLEDELYKTVVLLREGREKERQGREGLARNLANISHQLKTPLSAISLLSELLAGRVRDDEGQRYIGQILAQVGRLNGLAAALLTLSRLDAGTLALEPRQIAVRELLSCAAEPVLPLMEAKGQRLTVDGGGAISFPLDFRWTAEALSNLIKNCSEHTPQGGKVSVRCGQNPIYMQITVEDEGTGFDPEDLPHLFERFYRGKGAAEDSAGIGLALAQSLIRRQNGELHAENRAVGGARFVAKFYRVSPD